MILSSSRILGRTGLNAISFYLNTAPFNHFAMTVKEIVDQQKVKTIPFLLRRTQYSWIEQPLEIIEVAPFAKHSAVGVTKNLLETVAIKFGGLLSSFFAFFPLNFHCHIFVVVCRNIKLSCLFVLRGDGRGQ